MDPNETLKRLRDYACTVLLNDETESDDACQLAELVEGLDKWLRRGGFLPDEWSTAQVRP